MTDRESLLLRKNEEFQGLFRDAAKRYRVPGKVDEEIVLQECLILLNELLEYDVDPDSTAFSAIVRKAVYNRVVSLVRPYLTESRHYHREAVAGSADSINSRGTFLDSVASDPINQQLNHSFRDGTDPSVIAETRDLIDHIRRLLDPDAAIVFDLLIDTPPELLETLEEYNDKIWLWKDGTRRKLATRCNNPRNFDVLAMHLGWTKTKVRSVVRRIRREASKVFGEATLSLIG